VVDLTSSTEVSSAGSEVISFAIIERPFVALTTGSNVQYVMDINFESNFYYNPKPSDAFARNMVS